MMEEGLSRRLTMPCTNLNDSKGRGKAIKYQKTDSSHLYLSCIFQQINTIGHSGREIVSCIVQSMCSST